MKIPADSYLELVEQDFGKDSFATVQLLSMNKPGKPLEFNDSSDFLEYDEHSVLPFLLTPFPLDLKLRK